MHMDVNLAISFLLGAAILAGLASWIVLEKSRTAALRDRRMLFVGISGRGEVDTSQIRADIRRKQINSKLRALSEKQRFSRSRLGSVKSKLVQAGVDMGIARWWLICITLGLVAAMAWNTFGSRPILTPAVFLVFCFLLPRMWLNRRSAKRQAEFTKHFAAAIDVMVRGLRAGMAPQESIRLISTEIPDPVGSEFRTVVDQVIAGVPLPQALHRAYERLPTREMQFFATVISVQEQNGGNLGEILGKISKVIRGRAQLKEKAKALSGEARMSAIIIGALPFVVASVLFFANREYIALLWTTTLGNYLLGGAMVMMFLGVFIMKKMGELDV